MPTLRLATPSGSVDLAYDLDRPAEPTDLCALYAHGFASRRAGEKTEFFRRIFLQAGLAFCAFDFRGHGDSGGRLFDLSLSRNLDDLGAVHEHLRGQGFRRFVLFGSSMGGGTVAWYVGEAHPGVEAAILLAPGLEMERGLRRRLGDERFARWEEEGTVLFPHELGDHPLSWGLIEDLRRYDRQQLAARYRVPTLVFHGVQDSTVDYRSTVDFVASCKAPVELVLMADGDHRLIDRLPRLGGLTRDFLRAQGLHVG